MARAFGTPIFDNDDTVYKTYYNDLNSRRLRKINNVELFYTYRGIVYDQPTKLCCQNES